MAPTVQTGPREERERKNRNVVEKRSELVCRVKYNNTLPDIPFDPKFITYPFESNRFIQYKPTSLERTYKYDMLTEHDLGVTIDLINPETYKLSPNIYADSEDERLLEEEINTLHDSRRSRHHNTSVSWLRKTEYISTEYNRFIQKSDKHETKVGFKLKQIMKEEDLYKDRDSQIKAIEKTFENAKTNIAKHYSKPGVTPVEILPVFPDFDLWKHPFAQVIFDSDPAPKARTPSVQAEEMSQAMIRGAVDESGEQFVAYFLPTEETCNKRKQDQTDDILYQPDDFYDYTLAREYNWNVKNKLSKGYEETYFFIFRDDVVYYNELETRVRLSKRRKTGAGAAQVAKSRLIVKHRDLYDKEITAQNVRLTMLEPQQEEEEEEEEDEEEGSGKEEEEGSAKEDDGDKKSVEGSDGGNSSDNESVKSGGSSSSASSKKSNRSAASSRRKSSSSSSSSEGEGGAGSGDERSEKAGQEEEEEEAKGGSGSEKEAGDSGSESEAESEAQANENKKDKEAIFGSSSESEAEEEMEEENKEDEEQIFGSASDGENEPDNKKDEEEIFGVASSSDDSS
ncbi:RNA polymerase II-associated factor 1 homolog [Octopus vulgaris]|uniref:RNA polymerase II-associated factor 1 homolog n=2 Tax=Octopus TaxID=6643 RepID=A0AA36FL88_OCTVU|nr:RNA polymerase II-associated factor 1 homolog [Octopus sinensis]CAI9741817.1 RNA polymerase II-associated factor 1 homolog [Octopus vulgaris]